MQQWAEKNNKDPGPLLPTGKYTINRAIDGDRKSGIGRIFDQWEKFGDGDNRKLAFILGTARRESAGTFRPIREVPSDGNDEVRREKDIANLLRDRHSKRPNYSAPDADGHRYYGRGLVQVTLKENYATVSRKLGLGSELVDNPDKALDPELASEILVRGMMEGGWFGKYPLSHYFSLKPLKADWQGARDTANPGTPHRLITARYSLDFYKCLQDGNK